MKGVGERIWGLKGEKVEEWELVKCRWCGKVGSRFISIGRPRGNLENV